MEFYYNWCYNWVCENILLSTFKHWSTLALAAVQKNRCELKVFFGPCKPILVGHMLCGEKMKIRVFKLSWMEQRIWSLMYTRCTTASEERSSRSCSWQALVLSIADTWIQQSETACLTVCRQVLNDCRQLWLSLLKVVAQAVDRRPTRELG